MGPKPQRPPRVVVIADIDSNAESLVSRVLQPANIEAWPRGADAPPPDVVVVDITQLRGDPLANLRNFRTTGNAAPAIVLAAHFPLAKIRDLFRLGVSDFLLKPYRPADLCSAIFELSETRSSQADTQKLADRVEGMREQLRRRSDEIRMLSEIGRTVVSMDDLNAILRSVVEAAAYVTDAEEANIYLADPESKELILRASKQAGERHATLQKLRSTDTLVGEVYQSGQPVLRQPSLEAGPVKVQTGFLVQSTVNVPLRVREHVVGVLGVYNRLAPRTFTEHHLTLLIALADWAGVALEQASLRRSKKTAPPPEKPLTVAPPDLLDKVNATIASLEEIIQSQSSALPPGGRDSLDELLSQLRELRNIPMASLDIEQTEELVDLPALVNMVVDEMRHEAKMKGIELFAEKADPIPMFRGDSERARLVLEALVRAAIQRTKRGRVILETHRFEIAESLRDKFPLTVNVDIPDGSWAAVRVSDSSSGLSPDTVRAITSPETNPETGKMGAGLSMGEIRMIVESMGGVMWYEHTPASTSITFALPVQ